LNNASGYGFVFLLFILYYKIFSYFFIGWLLIYHEIKTLYYLACLLLHGWMVFECLHLFFSSAIFGNAELLISYVPQLYFHHYHTVIYLTRLWRGVTNCYKKKKTTNNIAKNNVSPFKYMLATTTKKKQRQRKNPNKQSNNSN
jgi:hypothetical protein